jgi:prevent-host-death family protein
MAQPQYRLRVGEIRVFYDVVGAAVHVLAIVAKSWVEQWLQKQGPLMKKIALTEVEDDLAKYLRIAEEEEVVITQGGKPAGVLIGFKSEDDWLDWELESDPRFLRRIEEARQGLREGGGVRLEEVEE